MEPLERGEIGEGANNFKGCQREGGPFFIVSGGGGGGLHRSRKVSPNVSGMGLSRGGNQVLSRGKQRVPGPPINALGN